MDLPASVEVDTAVSAPSAPSSAPSWDGPPSAPSPSSAAAVPATAAAFCRAASALARSSSFHLAIISSSARSRSAAAAARFAAACLLASSGSNSSRSLLPERISLAFTAETREGRPPDPGVGIVALSGVMSTRQWVARMGSFLGNARGGRLANGADHTRPRGCVREGVRQSSVADSGRLHSRLAISRRALQCRSPSTMPKTFPRRVGLGFSPSCDDLVLHFSDEASARRISIRGARGGEVNARASTRDGRYRPVIRR